MTQSKDKLKLKNLCFSAKHGCYPEEKVQAQPFCVSITMQVKGGTAAAAATDNLNLSIDYSQTYLRVKDLVENNTFNLIETLAERIATLVLAEPLVERVWVEVEKSAAAAAGQTFCSAVAIERGVADGENLS